jgi:zinc protease
VQKGDVYSPSAGLNPSQTYPGYGYLLTNVEIPPSKVDVFFTDVQKIAQDLRAQPVTQDELNRAVRPLVEDISHARESNSYWVSALTGAQTDPRRLQAVRTQLAQYEQVTAADLQKAAQKYLEPDRAWKFEVLPEARVADAAPSGGAPTVAAK